MSHIHGARRHHHHRRKESILSKKDSVMVVARFRPTNERERKGQHTEELFEFPSDSSLKIKTDEPFLLKHSTPQTQFTYDRVFGPDANQEDVYKVACSKMLEDLFHGINCTVLAYGQTGSGKTHTMMGSKEKRGVIPRLVSSVFEHIDEHYGHSEAAEQKEHHVEVSVSYVEIYMDHVKDLLKPRNTNLRIRENHGHGIWVEGVCEARVISQDDVMHVMDLGSRNRATGRTNMNAHSSRSHSVFFLKLQQLHKDNTTARSSKLILVDLAGSERVENSGATGQTLKEAQQINKSLSALGNVIHSLTTKGSHHSNMSEEEL